MEHENHNTIGSKTANRWPFGAIVTQITLRSLFDHVILGIVCCAIGAAIITFSGLVISGVVALPTMAPLALPILSCSCVCFIGGAAMVSYHFFWRTPRQKTPPRERQPAKSGHFQHAPQLAVPSAQDRDAPEIAKSDQPTPDVPSTPAPAPATNVIPAPAPDPTPAIIPGPGPKPPPISPVAWSHEQTVAAFESKFAGIDTTRIPWRDVGMPNNALRCFANSALQMLFNKKDFRNLVYMIIKFIPTAQTTCPVTWCVFEIMQYMQCNPTIPLPREMMDRLLNLIDDENGIASLRTGQQDSLYFVSTLFDAMSEEFYPSDIDANENFDTFVANSMGKLSMNEALALRHLHILPGNTPCELSEDMRFDFYKKVFFAFTGRYHTKSTGAVAGEMIEVSNAGIPYNFNGCQDSLHSFLAHGHDKQCDMCCIAISPHFIAFNVRRANSAQSAYNRRGGKIEPVLRLPKESTICPVAEEYELSQILWHSGSATGGHYWADIRCDDGEWRRFNDSTVSEIPREEIFRTIAQCETDCTANGAEFMQLVYKAKPPFLWP
jgi:hypothetical protein